MTRNSLQNIKPDSSLKLPSWVPQLDELIHCARYQDGLIALQHLQCENSVEKRIMLHYRGFCQSRLGYLHLAKKTLEEAFYQHGENIQLLTDLSAVYFRLGEIDLWKSAYGLMQRILQEKKALIGKKARTSTSLILGKYLETEGHVVEALRCYENILESLSYDPKGPCLRLPILCQTVRLKSSLNESHDLGALYSELLSAKKNGIKVSKDLEFEIHHALMLAELILVGAEHAWHRVKSSLMNDLLINEDKNRIYYDFLEEALIRQLPLPPKIDVLWKINPDTTVYELEVRKLALAEETSLDLGRSSRIAPDMCWAEYLRLLTLKLALEKKSSRSEELKNKINLLLTSLQPSSRAYWQDRLKPFLRMKDLSLVFDPTARGISYQNRQLDLSRKKGMLMLVAALIDKGSQITVEDAILLLWQSDFSPEHYHRLRMMIHRLNKHIFDISSIEKAIEINADEIKLKPAIQLRSAMTNPKEKIG